MRSKILFTLLFVSLNYFGFSQRPASHPNVDWNNNLEYSDEFNSGVLDENRWNKNPSDWGTWSWEPENASVIDTALALQMVQHTHIRNGENYYFTSGILRNEEPRTYGYYEARILATDKGQGTCPAFWLYSRGQPDPTEEGEAKYCEIDAIEIFQIPNQLSRLEMNLHTRILENGELVWKRPGQGFEALTRNTWVAPWDPRDEYHTYGVWNRPDSILWYVDGVQRGGKKNYYWHLPMHITVSLGLRTPYERYINGVRTIQPFPDSIPEPGFPTQMFTDYVRVWDTPAQLYIDRELYYDQEFSIYEDLEIDAIYFAGQNETILVDGWLGVTCNLQELDENGIVVNELTDLYPNAIGKESGKAKFSFDLTGLTPSSALPAGHTYAIRPVFRTSQNDGEDIYMEDEQFYPILLTETTSVNSLEAKEKIKIFSSNDGVNVQLSDLDESAQIFVTDLAGKQWYHNPSVFGDLLIDNGNFPTSGVYLISVKTDKLHRLEKVIIAR